MKSRLTLIFAALVVLLGAMLFVVEDRAPVVSPPAMALATPTPAPAAEVPISPPAPVITTDPLTAALAPVPVPSTVPPIESDPLQKSAPMVRVAPSGDVKYVARAGDTVSQLAVALLGSDNQENRDAVIDANASLKPNPDRVLAGQTYSIAPAPASTIVPAAAAPEKRTAADQLNATVSVKTDAIAIAQPEANPTPTALPSGPKLKYIAQPGDTVGILAANLLGGDNKINRDLIIAANKSLQDDPDHLVAGQTYTIVAPEGLASAVDATAKSPTTQPDADEAARLSVGRTLRYTARPGDSVSKLAIALLGEDTPANRDLIIKSNPTLRADPDHLIAGQTYWIAAPNP